MLSINQIERRAQKLLDDARVKGPGFELAPVAKKLGAEIRYVPTQADVSGALFRREKTPVIGVNKTHADTRKRFTIAHEIGHLVLHHEDMHMDDAYPTEVGERILLRDKVSEQAIDPKEIEANRFAAALLMPISFLRKSLQSFRAPLRQSDIEKLSDEYKVSNQAMTFRLTNLGVPVDIG